MPCCRAAGCRLLVEGEPVGWLEPAMARSAGRVGRPRRRTRSRCDVGAACRRSAGRWRRRARSAGAARRSTCGATPDGPVLGADRSRRAAAVRHPRRRACMSTGWWRMAARRGCGWGAGRRTGRWMAASSTISWPAACRPGIRRRRPCSRKREEEAGLPPELAGTARPVGVIEYAMQRPEGLRRDRLHCYDLTLPAVFAPEPCDGEVDGLRALGAAARAGDGAPDRRSSSST